jgi:hypothetical protein
MTLRVENFTTDTVKLGRIADLTESLGSSPHAEAIRDLAALLEDDGLRVVVFGEFSVGKSTLINALFGRVTLPAKAMPTTGHVTRIRFGDPEGVQVRFTDGRTESCPLDQIGSFVTLDLHSRARDGIEAIDLLVKCPLLVGGLALIDTPGTNDAAAQTRRAERAVMACDLVLLVLRADQMLGAEIRHRAAVWMARELGKPVVPVLNGMNLVEDERDRRELRRLLGAWSEANLAPALVKPFFEVNAMGALRHTLGLPGAAAPADDFLALKTALEGLTGRRRQELRAASRTNQARAVLRSVAAWNRGLLDRLAGEADALRLNREKQRDRLRHAIDGLEHRLPSEDVHVRALASEELRRGWGRLAQRLVAKGKEELEQKSRQWFDTYLEEAVRTAERRASERMTALASEVGAPPPEPLTVSQLVSLSQRTDVKLITPDNSGAVALGVWAGAATGAAIGSVVPIIGTTLGAVIGLFAGGFLAGKATQKEPDYAADYTTAARIDWDKVAPTIEQTVGAQFQARLDGLLKGLKQHSDDLGRTPPAPEELRLRRQLQGLLERVSSDRAIWRFDRQRRSIIAGEALQLETRAPAVIRWSSDGWKTCHDTETRDTGPGLHIVDLPTMGLPAGGRVQFTFRWPETGRWEGRDFAVEIVHPETSDG